MKNEMSFFRHLIKKLIVIKDKDPILKLYDNFLYEINNMFLEYYYYNISKINDVLYDYDKIVNIQPLEGNNDKLFFQYYFYLDLLINYKINITKFNFSIDVIKNANEQQNDDSKKLKKLIISKIVIDLINSYKSIDLNLSDLPAIKETSQNILNDNFYIFKKMSIEIKDIKNISLEELYIKIINSLIENRKFEDYQYTYYIIEQLNLEYINLTKEMLEKLLRILNSDKSYIKEYIILEYNDLLDIKKINFYYILLKYLLKNSFYIYQILFLLKTRNEIIKIIKTKCNRLFADINKTTFKEKIKYIIEFLSDSPYYISNYKSKEYSNEFDDSKNQNNNTIKINSNINDNISKENVSLIKMTNNYLNNTNDPISKDITVQTDDRYYLKLKSIFKKDNINIIKELTNDFIIISGNNNCRIYDYEYNELINVNFEEPIYNIFEVNKNINKGKEKKSFFFIVNFENNKFYKYEFSIKDNNELTQIPKEEYQYPYSLFYLEINFQNIFCGKNGIIYYTNFFSKITDNNLDHPPQLKDPIYGGIQIDNDHAVLISKDSTKLKFVLKLLNIKGKKLEPLEIEGYSLNLSPNCLSFLKINNEKKEILVLCSCKRKENEREGFLYFIFGENKPIFRETNFKVNCFCQLSKFKLQEKNIFNYIVQETNCFLVGGGNEKDKSKEGIIKLFKYDENDKIIKKGNEIQNKFNEPISCIIQSRKNGNILISCIDGNLYSCDKEEIKEI